MVCIYLVFLELISSVVTLDCVTCYKYDLSKTNLPEQQKQLLENTMGFHEQGEAIRVC